MQNTDQEPLFRIVIPKSGEPEHYDALSLRDANYESSFFHGTIVTVQLLSPVTSANLRGPGDASHATVAGVKRQLPMSLQPLHSDEFNYVGKPDVFQSKWADNHRHGWVGPGDSLYTSNRSWVANGNLIIEGRRAADKKVGCGYVTSHTPVMYPVYSEVRMQASGLKLASAFWLLSDNDVNEIDIIEVYGSEPVFGKSMGTNFHIFQRTPLKDIAYRVGINNGLAYYSSGVEAPYFSPSWPQPGLSPGENELSLKDGFHTYGVYWKSATEFEFYLDGRLVRKLNRNNELYDPRNRFFDQPMHLIMNTESHNYRYIKGITPTDAELANNKINNVYFDWIHTFK